MKPKCTEIFIPILNIVSHHRENSVTVVCVCVRELVCVVTGMLVTMAINPTHAVEVVMETETKTQGIAVSSYV